MKRVVLQLIDGRAVNDTRRERGPHENRASDGRPGFIRHAGVLGAAGRNRPTPPDYWYP